MAEVRRAILDTSVLVAEEVPALEGELAVSTASLAELHFGALATDDVHVRAQRVRRLTLIEHLFTPLAVDDAVARSYGQLASMMVRRGRQPRGRVMDLVIAATVMRTTPRFTRAMQWISAASRTCSRSCRSKSM